MNYRIWVLPILIFLFYFNKSYGSGNATRYQIQPKKVSAAFKVEKILLISKKRIGQKKINSIRKYVGNTFGLNISYIGKNIPILFLSTKENKDLGVSLTKSVCREIKKGYDNTYCTGNVRFVPLEVTTPVDIPQKESNELEQRCNLFRDEKNISYEGRSDFWAIEATGADLVDAERNRSALNYNVPTYICDTYTNQDSVTHGKLVKAIVDGSSKKNSSTPYSCLDYSQLLKLLDETKDESKNGPVVINFSMGPLPDPSKVYIPRELSEHAQVIQAAGNHWVFGDTHDATTLENKENWFIVGSVDPFGLPSYFSEESGAVLVSAPSDFSITSCPKGFSCEPFGGTSGAAPQVSHILKAINEISPHFSRKNLRDLIRQTALKLPFSYDRPPLNGTGSLNSYKLWKVAEKIARLCGSEMPKARIQKCINDSLTKPETYQFEVELSEEILGATYPGCFKHKFEHKIYSCSDIKNQFHGLRKLAFLKQDNKELWRKLSCIQKEHGFDISSKFYSNIGRDPKVHPFTLEDLNIAELTSRSIRASPYLNNKDILELKLPEDKRKRSDVAASLWNLGPRTLPLLEKLFKDKDPYVRGNVMNSAARIGASGLPLLREGALDSDYRIKTATANFIHHQGVLGIPILKDLMIENSTIIGTSIESARLIGPEALSLLEPLLNSQYEHVRESAQSAIDDVTKRD